MREDDYLREAKVTKYLNINNYYGVNDSKKNLMPKVQMISVSIVGCVIVYFLIKLSGLKGSPRYVTSIVVCLLVVIRSYAYFLTNERENVKMFEDLFNKSLFDIEEVFEIDEEYKIQDISVIEKDFYSEIYLKLTMGMILSEQSVSAVVHHDTVAKFLQEVNYTPDLLFLHEDVDNEIFSERHENSIKLGGGELTKIVSKELREYKKLCFNNKRVSPVLIFKCKSKDKFDMIRELKDKVGILMKSTDFKSVEFIDSVENVIVKEIGINHLDMEEILFNKFKTDDFGPGSYVVKEPSLSEKKSVENIKTHNGVEKISQKNKIKEV